MSLLRGIRLYKIITNSIVYFAFRVLPRSCNCTGGNDLWKSSFVNGSERWCEGQRADACKVLNGTVILFITTTNWWIQTLNNKFINAMLGGMLDLPWLQQQEVHVPRIVTTSSQCNPQKNVTGAHIYPVQQNTWSQLFKMPNIAIHLVSHYSADKYIPVHLSGKPIKYYCTILYVATVWIKIQWIALSTFWINKRNIITL